MSDLLIATVDELRLLTKREREVYEMFRHEGLRKEEICLKLHVGKEAFRRYWWSAVKKIRRHRQLTENPQYFLARGHDILGGGAHIGIQRPADTSTISNTSRFNRPGEVAPGPNDRAGDEGDAPRVEADENASAYE